MRFGVYLPTFAWPDLSFDQAARVKAFARKAEDLGFDALWVAEHFLVAPGLYGTVWMSPTRLAAPSLRRRRGAPRLCRGVPSRQRGAWGARARPPCN
jgi:hypothetical protein